MKYFKIFLELLLIGFIPGLLIYFGEHNSISDWFIEHHIFDKNKITSYQTFSFVVGLSFSSLILPFKYNIVKSKKQNLKKNNNELLKEYKNKFIENLKANIGQHNTIFYVRIFEPDKSIKSLWNSFWHQKKCLILKHYYGITDEFEHKKLKFEISKNKVQGVVGKSFNEKAIYIDTDLDNNNYELTEAHKLKIGDIGFCAAIPIFNDNENKIIRVLSIDSPKKINLDANQKKIFEKQIILLAAFVDKYLK